MRRTPFILISALYVLAICTFSTAHAQQWRPTSAPTENWVSVASSADGTKLVAAASDYYGGPIYVSTNSGADWFAADAPFTNWISVACSADGVRLVAAAVGGVRGEPGPVYVSTDSGASWSLTTAPIQTWQSVASSADGSILVAAARWGPIYVSTDSGTTWAISPIYGPGPTIFLNAVASSADGTRLITGGCDGYIYVSTNTGASWITAGAHWDCWFSIASSADGAHLAAVVPASGYSSGLIYTSTNSGTDWAVSGAPNDDWTSIASSADGTVLLAGAGGVYDLPRPIFISTDSGANWIPSDGPILTWNAVATSADGTKLVAAAYGGGIYVLQAAAPLATTLSATQINTAVVLNATVGPNGLATAAWFQWGLSTNYGNSTVPLAIDAGWTNVPIESELDGLALGTDYHYRVVATNGLGYSTGQDQIVDIPGIMLNGPELMTNECHTAFIDPGATAFGAPPPPPLAVSAGAYHSLALLADRTIVGWGSSEFGEANPPPEATNVVAISAGGYTSLALRADGSMIFWGLHMGGIVPPETETDFVAVAAGYGYGMALKADGTVTGWGRFEIGYEPPVDPPAGLSNVVVIAAGYGNGFALKTDGTVVCWGDNSSGETNVPSDITNVVAISAGAAHALALRADGTVAAWGSDDLGQTDVPAAATNIVAIAAGGLHSLALRADGTLLAWGWDASGQTDIPPNATNVVEISAGYYDSLAKTASGLVIGWGGDYYGQSSVPGSLNTNYLPVSVSGTMDPDTPGIYTLSYTVTNSLGFANGVTRTVYVVDTTPPQFLAVTNVVAEFYNISGEFVNFNVTAMDQCSGIEPVTCFPPSGSLFPIGTNTVSCFVTDGSGNSSQTNFMVVVLGARGVTGDVLAEMQFVAATAPQREALSIRMAIGDLSHALAAKLWLDEAHLNPIGGASVFDAERMAAKSLETYPGPHEIGWVNRLVKATRLLALVELNTASHAKNSPRALLSASAELTRGDNLAARHQYAAAIERYESAWKLAAQFVNKPGSK